MDLLTTYTHHSELQVITAPLLISIIHGSPQHPLSIFPAFYVFNTAMASNSCDSSASHTHVVTVQQMSGNWTLSANLGSSLCSLRVDRTENCLKQFFCYGRLPGNSPDIISTRTCLRSRLLRNGCSFIHLLHNSGCIHLLQGLCIALGLYATIIYITWLECANVQRGELGKLHKVKF
jgi:hypothetical protein